MSVIEINDLTKSFDDLVVLDGLNLQVPAGTVYGLVGPAGAGKTTLLHLLLGFLRPDRGTLRVLGNTNVAWMRWQIGYLPQGQHYHARFTPREYLRFLGQCAGLASRGLEQQIASELEVVHLTSVANQPIERLTRAQQQRLGIAQALLGRPPLLLLDEPVAELEAPGEHGLLDLVAGLRERGQTVLLATQRLHEADYLCDRIGVLVGGRLAAEAETRALRKPGRNALITVDELTPAMIERLCALSPAVHCEGNEIALQPNDSALQARVLAELIAADVAVIALEPFGRPIEELYLRAVRGLAQEVQEPSATVVEDAGAPAPSASVPGRPGSGDTFLRELLKSEDQRNP